jgi:hypothetical protein
MKREPGSILVRDGGQERLLVRGVDDDFDEALAQLRVEKHARKVRERKEYLVALPVVAGFIVGIALIAQGNVFDNWLEAIGGVLLVINAIIALHHGV